MAARKKPRKSSKSESKSQIKISQQNPFWTHLPEGTKTLSLSKDAALKMFQQFMNLPLKDFVVTEADGTQTLEFKF